MLRLFHYGLLVANAMAATTAKATSATSSLASSTASSSPTSSSTASSSPTTQPLMTVQLFIPEEDAYYNALVTDDGGEQLGLRVDFLQPDIWFPNGLAISDCAALVSEESVSITATICYLYGAYTPYVTATVTNGTVYETVTETSDWATAEATSIAYPDGIVANGVQATANMSVGVLGDQYVELNTTFGLVDDTNVFTGGLGLAKSDSGLGLLNALVKQGVVPGIGFSTYFSDYADNSTGHLLLSAVNQLYYTGDFYQFPPVLYEGWTDGTLDTRPLPIVGLDSVILYNPVSDKAATLYDNLLVAAVIDPRSSFSYLPWDAIIELAVQTNAYFLLDIDRWLVRCSDIELSKATVNFTFGPLIVPVPLTLILTQAYYNDNYLYFSNGDSACYLSVLPSTNLGYCSLGLPFITQIYFAMDSETGAVAMANKRANVNVSNIFEDNLEQVNGTFIFPLKNDTAAASVGYITSGYIPFATVASNSTNLTMTFSDANMTNTEVIPARFSAAIVQSGEVYVTLTDSTRSSTNSASATAASAPSSSSGAKALVALERSAANVFYYLLFMGGILGVCFA